MTNFTIHDVIDYLAGQQMTPERHDAIEHARYSDPRVGGMAFDLRQAIYSVVAEDQEAMAILRQAWAKQPPLSSPAQRGPSTGLISRWWDRSTSPWWKKAVPDNTLVCADGDRQLRKDPTYPDRNWSIDFQDFVVECPFDNPQKMKFEYGAAILGYRTDDGCIARTCLFAVARNSRRRIFQARVPLARVLPEGVRQCQVGNLRVDPVTDDPDLLNQVRMEDVDTLLRDDFVMARPELWDDLFKLLVTIYGRGDK